GFTNLITGLGVTCQGTIMRVEDFEFTVDVPCSGLKSIISLTALAALVTYFTPTANWKKVLLFAASVPVAVAANVGRIFVILCLGKAFGQKVAMGFFHEFSGLLVFFLAVLMIVGLVNLTTLGEKPASPSKPPSENATPCLAASFRRLVGMAAGLLLAANGLAYGLVFPLRRPPPTAANISVFPLCLGEWIGEEEEVPQLYYQMLEADQIIQRTYRRENSPSKVLSKVGLLAVVGRGRRTIHSPVGCYRAAGQQIVHLEERTFALPGRNPTRWCKLLVRTREGERLLALFTYTDGRVTTPSWSRQQFLAALQSLRRDPRPWFQIHLTAPILQDEESAFATLREFLTLLWPFVETATGAN
ncbi:MAG TPA: exosortase-associated EpsI family protein, partial [Armatimonadetes bacterium]|nr:exosortase-associated EpsI family protein [Armatimonadota bacterium]